MAHSAARFRSEEKGRKEILGSLVAGFKLSSVLFAILLISLISSLILDKRMPPQAKYWHMQLVQTWIPTHCSTKSCISGLNANFTLHGLWPANYRGQSLWDCPGYTGNEVSHLEGDLRQSLQINWPSIERGRTDEWLWDHEWKTHGVCSLPHLNAEQYFTAANREKQKIDLLGILTAAGIHPSVHRGYTKSAIINSINTAFGGVFIYLSCYDNKTVMLVKEFYICFDNTVTNRVDCPSAGIPRTCDHGRDIYLPSTF